MDVFCKPQRESGKASRNELMKLDDYIDLKIGWEPPRGYCSVPEGLTYQEARDRQIAKNLRIYALKLDRAAIKAAVFHAAIALHQQELEVLYAEEAYCSSTEEGSFIRSPRWEACKNPSERVDMPYVSHYLYTTEEEARLQKEKQGIQERIETVRRQIADLNAAVVQVSLSKEGWRMMTELRQNPDLVEEIKRSMPVFG